MVHSFVYGKRYKRSAVGNVAARRWSSVVGDVCDDEPEREYRAEPHDVGAFRSTGGRADQVRRAELAARAMPGRSEKAECLSGQDIPTQWRAHYPSVSAVDGIRHPAEKMIQFDKPRLDLDGHLILDLTAISISRRAHSVSRQKAARPAPSITRELGLEEQLRRIDLNRR